MEGGMYIVVVGCGRLGSSLAGQLSRAGHAVVTIDQDERAFRNLSEEYSGFLVEGDATELAVLRESKMEKADVVIATTRDDNINLMVAQIAQTEFGVRRVLARVYEPRRQQVYQTLGVEAVCPTELAAAVFLRSVEKVSSE